jgi:hypothetical protein
MTIGYQQHHAVGNERLNRRLEDIGWGLFLVMIGVLWLVPDTAIPRSTWIIGAGMIMIGINGIRRLYRIPVNGFSLGLGILAAGAGIANIFGIGLPLFPMILVVVGAMILFRPLISAESDS